MDIGAPAPILKMSFLFFCDMDGPIVSKALVTVAVGVAIEYRFCGIFVCIFIGAGVA